MTQIVIEKVYRSNRNTGQSVVVEEGDIALVGTKRRPLNLTLGIIGAIKFNELYGGSHVLRLRPAYRLKENSVGEGNITISEGRFDSRYISEIYVGKEAILERILADERLRNHSEWIRKLEKPYKFPDIKSLINL